MDLEGPALAAPSGVVIDLENPPNENGMAVAVLATCAAVATVCVALRAYGKCYLMRQFHLEDMLIILGYGVFWGSLWAGFRMVDTPGYFVHQWNVKLKHITSTYYSVLVYGVCYSLVLPCLKCAILLEWCRLFVRGNRMKNPFWIASMIIIAIQVIAGVGIVIALNVQCTPHAAIYDITITDKKCVDLFNIQMVSAGVQLLSDVTMLLLPQHVIWKLQMSVRKRLGLAVVFGLGLLACVSASFRISVNVTFQFEDDKVYYLSPLVFWVTAEQTCGFFIACVPCIPKILRDSKAVAAVKRTLGMTGASQSGAKSGGGGKNSGNALSKGQSAHGALTGGTTTSNAYYKLDEDGVAMGDIAVTESTEHLHRNDDFHHEQDGKPNTITRTTRVMVTRDESFNDDQGSRGSAV